MSDKYNGWTNYETWATKLWMDNDEGSYHFFQELAQNAFDENTDDRDAAEIALAQAIKDFHEENTPITVGVYADLLNAALSEVDWHEIAASLLDDGEFEWQEAS